MPLLTDRSFAEQIDELVERISQHATPFPRDTTAKRLARVRRATVDKFFFAVTYFPHYVKVRDGYAESWRDPDTDVDWIKAGFADVHPEFFRIADQMQRLTILAAFRESAKDTLLGTIDVVHKLVVEDGRFMRSFVAMMAMTQTKAESKSIPIKLELEKNARLRSDFGDLVGVTKWENGEFVLKNGRGLKCYGREQALRGETIFLHRPDHIVLNDINDPTKPDSPAQVLKFVDSVKSDILYSVNSERWSALYLCNYTVKDDIVDALMTGKNTSHYNKLIVRALVRNPMVTDPERLIAEACRAAGLPDNMMSVWEFRHPTTRLLQEQRDDPDTFNTERMMYPRNRKDQKFKDSYFRFHTRAEVASGEYVFYTSVDPSGTAPGDAKAVITLGVGTRPDGTLHMPVVKAGIQQESVDWMLEETWRQFKKFSSRYVGVETNAYKDFIKREYVRLMGKKKRPLPFVEIVQKLPKQGRIELLVPLVKEGIITFDLEDPDQEILIRQLKMHPNQGSLSSGGIGDDGADSLATCKELVDLYPPSGTMEYESVTRREARFGEGAF